MSKKQMNASVKSIVVLLAICLVVAVAMAAIHQVTAPKIEEASRKAEQEALRAVLSEATEFLPVEGEYAPSVSALYRDAGGAGYAVLLSAKGYDASNPIKLAAGFDADGKILCLSVISCSGETSGIGTKVAGEDFLSSFVGKDQTLAGVDAISGATISSSAVLRAVAEGAKAVESVIASEVVS